MTIDQINRGHRLPFALPDSLRRLASFESRFVVRIVLPGIEQGATGTEGWPCRRGAGFDQLWTRHDRGAQGRRWLRDSTRGRIISAPCPTRTEKEFILEPGSGLGIVLWTGGMKPTIINFKFFTLATFNPSLALPSFSTRARSISEDRRCNRTAGTGKWTEVNRSRLDEIFSPPRSGEGRAR